MIFANLFFLYCFLPVCILCYALAKRTETKNIVLIAFSLCFYAWSEPKYIFLLLGCSVVNYAAGRLIDKFKGKNGAKLTLILALVIDIGLLAAFKYTGFLVRNFNSAFNTSISVPNILLPIGISFYTFQAISYVIDCYWEKIEVQKSYRNFLLYLSLFPQLIAGPIVRYSTIEKELTDRRNNLADISAGFTRIVTGLAKKVLIANSLGDIVENIFGVDDISAVSVVGTWYGVALFALHIYFDFSGYSDMAIGLGQIFGFHFNENFNYPFTSKSITEFWQRWHISLGNFFKDYLLYIPLFGKRRQYLSLFLVWFCTGLWHGASWNFIIWGLYFGLFIFVERLITMKRLRKVPPLILHIYSKLVIVVGFGIFYFTDFSDLGKFLKNIVGANGNPFVDEIVKSSFISKVYLIAAAVIFSLPVAKLLKKFAARSQRAQITANTAMVAANVVLLIVSSIILADTATASPFFYFRF